MIEIIPNWHPVFVHFTVALLSVSAVLYAVTAVYQGPFREQWRSVAQWNLWLGAGFTLFTVLSGVYAYNTVAHDDPSHAAMSVHRTWAIVTAALFLSLAIRSAMHARRQKPIGTAFVVAILVAGGVLATTAWRGGELVYRYGLGVKSLPKSEGVGHAHTHAEGAAHDASHDAVGNDHHDAQPAQINPSGAPVGQPSKVAPAKKEDHHYDDGHTHEHK